MDALEILENIETLDIKVIAGEAVQDNKEVIADLIAGQMAQGIKEDGSEILPSYRPLTIELKSFKGGLAGVTDHVTLFDTGEFYSDLFAEVEGEDLITGSKNWKDEKLDKKYSSAKASIYGMTEDSADELISSHLEGDFLDKAHENLGI